MSTHRTCLSLSGRRAFELFLCSFDLVGRVNRREDFGARIFDRGNIECHHDVDDNVAPLLHNRRSVFETMADELKPQANSEIDYFDAELRVDDSSTDGSKVFHVGKYYTKGADYYEQRKDFWLDLAKREAMIGNSTVIESALEWAEKRAKSAMCRRATRSASHDTLTKAEADDIRNLLTIENKTDFNRKRLTRMIDQAKTHAHMGDRSDMEHALSAAKEFAESVGLYNDDLELELNDIPSLVTTEQEVKNAIRMIPGALKHATAAVRMGYVDVVVMYLTSAENNALLGGIDIDEKVRDIIASLTPEQQKEFRKISDEKAKAKVADENKKIAEAETEAKEDDNEIVIANDKAEAKVAGDGNETSVADGIKNEVAGGDEISVNDGNTQVKNMAGDDAKMTGVDDKPKTEFGDESGIVGVDDKSETGDNEKVVDQESIIVDEMAVADNKPETKKATDDLQMRVVDDKTQPKAATLPPTTAADDKHKNVGESDPMTVVNDKMKVKTMTE